jgi:G6PDH family F420-dependent oxidoreductase
MVATQPRPELTQAFEAAAGSGKPKYGQITVSVDDDEASARRLAHERFRFSAPGWKVMSELPNPINFEAATAHVREDDVAEMVSCGPDLDRHADAIRQWSNAGFDQVAIVQVGDPERLFENWERELRPRLDASPVT